MKLISAMDVNDCKALDAAPDLMLAEWWCLLNRWDWPREGLGEPEPMVKYGSFVVGSQSNTRRGRIMSEIMSRIGSKECLREWNRATLPGQAFDVWWDARDLGG